MANIKISIMGEEVSVTPKDKAIFPVSPKLFLDRVAQNLALNLKAKAEEAGLPIPESDREERKKNSRAYRMISAKTYTELQANGEELLSMVEEVKAIVEEAKKKNAAYAPKPFEAYLQKAEDAVQAEKDAILTAVSSAIAD